MCSEQFNLTHLFELNPIHLFLFYVCLFLFRVTDNLIPSFSLVPFFSLSVRAQSFNNRLTHFFNPPLTYHLHTPQRRSYRDTHCMLKFTGRPWHRKKGMGNCLFIPSELKIEYRNPYLLPGVGFTEALAASFIHSIPPALAMAGKKSATPGTLLTAVSLTHNHTNTHTHAHREWHTLTHTSYLRARKMTRTR